MDNKVAIISIWDIDNYGNRLQNYAMQSAVRTLGYEPYTLKMWPQKKWKRIFQYITNFDVSRLRMMKLHMSGNERKCNFIRFERAHVQKDRHFYDQIEDRDFINKKYRNFIVGSDQVWHPVFLEEDFYFLKFADANANTIAYAASMGVSQLKEKDQKLLAEGVKGLKHISVREERAAEIIDQVSGRQAEVVVDPTLLVSKEEWEKVEKKPKNLNQDYMVLYFLGEISQKRWDYLKRISQERNLQIVVLGNPDYKEFYSAGPAEFLYLIHHAKLMCTDSFHGCVFSFIFETPFYVFDREDKLEKMNSRIDTLLSTFHLGHCHGNEEADYSLECDFTEGKAILEKKKAEGLTYLREALKNN